MGLQCLVSPEEAYLAYHANLFFMLHVLMVEEDLPISLLDVAFLPSMVFTHHFLKIMVEVKVIWLLHILKCGSGKQRLN